MFKYLCSIRGLNAERTINAISGLDIELYEVQRQEKKIVFTLEYKHKKMLDNYLKEHNIRAEFQALGVLFWLNVFKQKVGIIISLVLFILSLIISSSAVWQFNIQGNNLVSTSEIINVICQSGCNIGSAKTSIDTLQIEDAIVSNFDEISFASVIVKGNSLVVMVKEREEQRQEDFSPLYASFSGVITKLVLNSGTSLVKVGDVVQKGQILVEPYEQVGDKTMIVSPKAEIYADVYIKGQVEYNASGFVRGRTGEEYIERFFSVCGLVVPCVSVGDKSVLNGEYEVVESVENLPTPIACTQTKRHYYQIGDIRQADYERDKEMLEKQSQYLAYEQLAGNEEIEKEYTQTILIGEVYYITTYIQCQKNIISA